MTTSGAEPGRGIRTTLRDLEILSALHTARYLSTPQIQRLFWRQGKGGKWGRLKACQQRLALLTKHGLVRRIEQPTKRGEGSRSYIYALDRKGATLLINELGVEPHEVEWRPRAQEENYPFMDHLLATTDFRIALTEACEQTGVVLQEWMDEKELKQVQNVDRVELIGPQGRVVNAAVVPDAYFMLCRAGKCGIFFLEMDLMTVTIAPSKWEKRGWTRNVRSYQAYLMSEAFSQRYQSRRPRVLTVTGSPIRLTNLKRATENVFADLRAVGEDASAESCFWFGLLSLDLADTSLLTAPIWSVAGSDTLRALLE